MNDTVIKLLLALNRASRYKHNQMRYQVKVVSNYDPKADGVVTKWYLVQKQMLPERNLPSIEFSNVNELKEYLIDTINYWQRYR